MSLITVRKKRGHTIIVSSDLKHQPPVFAGRPVPAHVTLLKRSLDITVSLILIIGLLSWLMPVLYLLVKAGSPGPFLFIQRRIGFRGEVFPCYKVRTMKPNKDSDARQASDNDERITKIGGLLRRTHIDELPQLFNVLLGHMSLVGPRPHMLYHHELFSNLLPEYVQRHLVRPGLTGLAQAKGYHGATPNIRSIHHRTRLDLFYVRKLSIGLDLYILTRTATKMITYPFTRKI